MIRSKFEMATILAWLKEAGKNGMTADELRKETARGPGVDRALYYLKKDGWIARVGPGNRFAITPDHLDKL